MADETQVVEEAPELQEEGQPGQSETEQTSEPAVNLDDLEEFRHWKSKMDRRMSELQRAAQEREREAEELAEKLRQERLAKADPAERAEILETELRSYKAKTKAQQEAARRQQELTDKANRLLQKHGISWDDPRLDTAAGATPEGYDALVESVTDILAERARQTKPKSKVEERREKAQEQAKEGAAQTSSAKSGDSPEARQSFLETRRRFRRTGDLTGYAAWKREQDAKYGADTVNKWLGG